MTRLPIKVFISSPGDVEQERVITSRIIKRLAERYADRVELSGIFWEHEPLKATDTFQRQIVPPSQTDIAVCILWARLGTRLPKDITREDGSRYESGTEFEFEDAFLSQKKSGIPDLLVYRKTSEPLVSLTDEQELLSRIDQKRALDRFIDKWFISEDGSLTAAFHPFETVAQFEEIFEIHLSKLIEEKIQKAGIVVEANQIPEIEHTWKGNPFRGLEVFEYEHADVFFGRTRATEDILNQLRKQDQKGHPLITVLGMSGSGKSSVIRAGVVPLLTRPGVIEGVSEWRRAYMKPSDLSGDLVNALARSITSENAVPELNDQAGEYEELLSLLKDQPKAAATKVAGELKYIAKSEAKAELEKLRSLSDDPEHFSKIEKKYQEDPPRVQLILVIDQLEELFTQEHLTDQDREHFVQLLDALCRTQRVWIIASLRSDFYSSMSELQSFETLRKGDGQIDLYPPTPNEIYQMIRLPAQAAGLSFDENHETGERLDDRLRDAASKEEGSLPVLQFTLAELYKRRTESQCLTFTAYQELGGLEGALASAAEEAFESLSDRSQNSFGQLFRRLVNVSAVGDRVTKATCLMQDLLRLDGAKEFIGAFIERRLFISDQNEKNQAIVSVAHEALLRGWPRIKEWLEKDRELLQIKSRLDYACQQWIASDKDNQLLLNDGRPLEEARLLEAEQLPLSKEQQEFIKRSDSKNIARKRVKKMAISGLAVLTVIASITAFFANQQRQLALDNQKAAELAKEEAQRSDQLSQYRLSQVFTQQGLQAAAEYDSKRASLLFGAAWQYDKSATNEYLLASALQRLESEKLLNDMRRTSGGKLAFDSSEQKLLVTDQTGLLEVWSVPEKKLIKQFKPHLDVITKVAFSNSGQRIYSASADNTVKVLSDQGELIYSFAKHFGAVFDFKVTPDDSRLLSVAYDNNALLWDLISGELISRLSFTDNSDIRLSWLSESGDSAVVLSSNGVVSQWRLSQPKAQVIKQCQLPTNVNTVKLTSIKEGMIYPDNKGQWLLYNFDCEEFIFSKDTTAKTLSELVLSENAQLLSGGTGIALAVVDTEQNRVVEVTPWMESIHSYSSDNEQRTFAFANNLGDVHLYDRNLDKTLVVSQGFQKVLSDLQVSSKGHYVAAIDINGQLRLLTLNNEEVNSKSSSGQKVIEQKFSSGSYDIVVSSEGDLTIIDKGQEIAYLQRSNQSSSINAVALTKDAKYLLIASDTLEVWELTAQRLIKSISPKTDANLFSAVTLISDGQFAAAEIDGNTSVSDGGWRLFSLSDFSVQAESDVWSESISRIEDFRQGYYLLALAKENLQLWYAQTGKRRFTIDFNVSDFSVSPDGNKIAVGFTNGEIKVRRHTQTTLIEFQDEGESAHQQRVKLIRWSPDEKLLVSVSRAGDVKVWDATSGELKSRLEWSSNASRALTKQVVFSSDGRYLVTQQQDGTVTLWDPVRGTELDLRTVGDSIHIKFDNSVNAFVIDTTSGAQYIIDLPQIDENQGELVQSIKSNIPWGFARDKVRPSDEWLSLALLVLDEAIENEGLAFTQGAGYLRSIQSLTHLMHSNQYLQAAQLIEQAPKYFERSKEWSHLKTVVNNQFKGLIKHYTGHSERIEEAIFNPHDGSVITASWDNQIQIWRGEDESVDSLVVGWSFDNLSLHPNNNWLIAASYQDGTRVWNLDSLEMTLNLPRLTHLVQWSKDGSEIYGLDQFKQFYRYDNAGKLLESFDARLDGEVATNVRISSDGKQRFLFNKTNLELYLEGESSAAHRWFADDLSDEPNTEISDVLVSESGNKVWVALIDKPMVVISLAGADKFTPEKLKSIIADSIWMSRSEDFLLGRKERGFFSVKLNQNGQVAPQAIPQVLASGYLMLPSHLEHLPDNRVAIKNDTGGFVAFDMSSGAMIANTVATGKGYNQAIFEPNKGRVLLYNGEGVASLYNLDQMNRDAVAMDFNHNYLQLANTQVNSEQSSAVTVTERRKDTVVAHTLTYADSKWLSRSKVFDFDRQLLLSSKDKASEELTQRVDSEALAVFLKGSDLWSVFDHGILRSTDSGLSWLMFPNEWVSSLSPETEAVIGDSEENIEQTRIAGEAREALELNPLSGYSMPVIRKAEASPNGKSLAIVWRTGQVSLMSNTAPDNDVFNPISMNCNSVRTLRWLSENLLAVACDKKSFSLFDSNTKAKLLEDYELPIALVGAGHFDSGAKKLFLVRQDTSEVVSLMLDDTPVENVVFKSLGIITAFDYDGTSNQMVVTNDNGQLQLVKLGQSENYQLLESVSEAVNFIRFFNNGTNIVATTISGKALLIESSSGRVIREIDVTNNESVKQLFIDDSGSMVTISPEGRVSVIALTEFMSLETQ